MDNPTDTGEPMGAHGVKIYKVKAKVKLITYGLVIVSMIVNEFDSRLLFLTPYPALPHSENVWTSHPRKFVGTL